jgi:hypothetical protein
MGDNGTRHPTPAIIYRDLQQAVKPLPKSAISRPFPGALLIAEGTRTKTEEYS